MIGKVNTSPTGGQGLSLNIFTQLNEPDTKDGIWVQTDKQYENLIIDEKFLQPAGVWDAPVAVPNIFGGYNRYNKHICVVYKDEIYFIIDGKLSLFKFDGVSVSTVCSLPQSFSRIKMVVYQGRLHILSDQDQGEYYYKYNVHYAWDGVTWTQLPKYNDYIMYGTAAVYDNKIYAIGGSTYNTSDNVHCWDGATWASIAECPIDINTGDAIVYNGYLYVIGYAYDCYMERFDGSTWTNLGIITPYRSVSDACLVLFEGEVHLFSPVYDTKHLKFGKDEVWTEVGETPYSFKKTIQLAWRDKIWAFGGPTATYVTKYTTSPRAYPRRTMIIHHGDSHTGAYSTCLTDLSEVIQGRYRFPTSFDNVWYYGDGAFEWSAPMYYGDGTRWIKFKN